MNPSPGPEAPIPDIPEIPEIRTDRLVLRAFTESDLPVWNRVLFADPDVTRFLPIDGPLPEERL